MVSRLLAELNSAVASMNIPVTATGLSEASIQRKERGWGCQAADRRRSLSILSLASNTT